MLGTSYTTTELLLWALVATAIGIVIGWFLRQWRLAGELGDQLTAVNAEEEGRRTALTGEVEEWKTKLAGTSSDLKARTSELELRAADLERLNTQIAERDRTVRNLEAELKTGRKNVMKFEGQIEDRESTIAALRAAAKGSASNESHRRELDAANGTIGSLRKDAEGYQATISSLRIDLDLAKRDKTDLGGRVDASAEEIAALTTSLSGSRSTEEGLRARLAELETAAAADQQQQLAELQSKLRRAAQDRDTATTQLRELEALHAECADQAAAPTAPTAEDPDEAPETSTPESTAPAAEDPQETPEPSSPEPPADGGLPDKDTATAEVARIAARTRGTAPVVEDDLRKIHGVGPKLDGLLKSMDITSFRQVASFTAVDVQYVTAALEAFPGRIERDNWMASAAEEHSKKYGEPV